MNQAERLARTQILPEAPEGRVGPFDLVRKIGEGGMGTVYLGRDRELDRPVAVKILAPHLARDREFRERFLREARLIAKVEHPNVVPVYAAEAQEGSDLCYLAMKYVEGASLAAVARTAPRLALEVALVVARDVADALQAAHDLEIVHRDVKPDNILIDERGEVRVTDFGLAKSLVREPRLTQTGTFLGTPEYASPEQCQGGKIGPASDLYSLGVVLYEILAGEVPHRAQTPYALFKKIVEDRPASIREKLSAAIPEEVERLILDGLLSKNPEERLGDAGKVKDEIDRILTARGVDRNRARRQLSDAARLAAGTPSTQEPPKTPRAASRRSGGRASAPRRSSRGSRSPAMRPQGLWPLGALLLAAALLTAGFAFAWAGRGEDGPSNEGSSSGAPPVDAGGEGLDEWRAALSFPIRVGVPDFENQSPAAPEGTRSIDLEWYRVGLAELVISEMQSVGEFELLDRRSLMDRIKVARQGSENFVRRVAGDLALGLVVRGSYSVILGSEIYCYLSVETPGGWIVARADRRGKPEELLDLVEGLSSEILAVLERKLERHWELAAPAAPAAQPQGIAGAVGGERPKAIPEVAARDALDETDDEDLRRRQLGALRGRADGEGGDSGIADQPAESPAREPSDELGGRTRANKKGADGQVAGVAGNEKDKEKEGEEEGEEDRDLFAAPSQRLEDPQFDASVQSRIEPTPKDRLLACELFSRAQVLLETAGDDDAARVEALGCLERAVALDPSNQRFSRELSRQIHGPRDTEEKPNR